MTGNRSFLEDFTTFNGGYVAFGDNPRGGKVSGKGKVTGACIDPLHCILVEYRTHNWYQSTCFGSFGQNFEAVFAVFGISRIGSSVPNWTLVSRLGTLNSRIGTSNSRIGTPQTPESDLFASPDLEI
ncbi:hypothetical protein OSB04_016310 [Centaurea solstitialis]|uniref:Uncharacterized protein n=1 Tax=Centaurea solstitialis TaxID=347529 RepID=A0AA38TCK5_9ASTR|nr:hypothetical protein OSB04_016310 [Centaurea solstitialis]